MENTIEQKNLFGEVGAKDRPDRIWKLSQMLRSAEQNRTQLVDARVTPKIKANLWVIIGMKDNHFNSQADFIEWAVTHYTELREQSKHDKVRWCSIVIRTPMWLHRKLLTFKKMFL